MQPGFLVVVLPWEARVVLEGGAVTVGVLVGLAEAEGVAVVPAPDGDVGVVEDDTGGVQMVGLHVAQIDGFLP